MSNFLNNVFSSPRRISANPLSGGNMRERAAFALGGVPALNYEQKRSGEESATENATATQNASNAAWQAANPGLINPNSGESASQMAAEVLQGEFANWEEQFKPVELNLLNQSSLNNPEVLTNAVSNAGATVNQSYNALEGVERRRLAEAGTVMTPEQEAVAGRVRSLSKAAAVSGAENTARQQVATNNELIAMGTAPNPNIVQQSANSQNK